jgi:phosphatidylinositol alpha-mannosyltransferase
MVCPYSLDRPGGVQNQAVGLARQLAGRGHQVVVFAPADHPAAGAVRRDGVVVVPTGAPVHLPANGSVAPVSISPLALRRSARVLRQGRFDVVHVHEPFAPGLAYALLATGSTPPLVATFHRSGASAWYRALRPVTVAAAGRLAARCAVSEAAAATARRALGGEYEVLYNGIDTEGFSGVQGTPTSGPTILFLGRHEPRKGLAVLLEAHARLEALRGKCGGDAPLLPVTLWVGGDGPETAGLRARWPPSPTRHWLGVLSEAEKRSRLVGADVLCAPSIAGESFGIVLLEGMAAGTRVVASDIDGYRDASGGHSVLVPPGDPEALARALAGVLVGMGAGGRAAAPDPDPDPDPVADAGSLAGARSHADRWSLRELAAAYEHVYRRVIATGPRRPPLHC